MTLSRDKMGDILAASLMSGEELSVVDKVFALAEKSQALVDLLDDAEVNHGGLIGVKTLRCKNELRLELSRWSK